MGWQDGSSQLGWDKEAVLGPGFGLLEPQGTALVWAWPSDQSGKHWSLLGWAGLVASQSRTAQILKSM